MALLQLGDFFSSQEKPSYTEVVTGLRKIVLWSLIGLLYITKPPVRVNFVDQSTPTFGNNWRKGSG